MCAEPAVGQVTRMSGRAMVGLFLVYAMWASTWPVGKYALTYWTPLGLTAIRHVVAGTLLILLAVLMGNRLQLPSRSEIMIGATQYMLYYLLSYAALSAGTASVTAVVVGLYPVIVVFLSKGKTENRRYIIWPALVGAVGCLVIFMGVPSSEGVGYPIASLLLGVGAAAAQALATLIRREVTNKASVVGFTGRSMLVGGALAVAVAVITHDSLVIDATQEYAIWALIWLTLIGSAGTFLCVEFLLRKWPPSTFSISFLAVPCLAYLFSHAALGERLSFISLAGIIICGVAIFLASSWKINVSAAHKARSCLLYTSPSPRD